MSSSETQSTFRPSPAPLVNPYGSVVRGPRAKRYTLEYFQGIGCVSLSTVGFALASSLVKINRTDAGRLLPIVELTFLRAIGGFVVFGALLKRQRLSLLPDDSVGVRLAFLRGLFDAISSTAYYYACISLPIALAAIILAMTPITSSLLAKVVLNEPFNFGNFVCMLGVCAGVCIAVYGTDVNSFPDAKASISASVGIACAFVAAACQSIQLVLGRKVMSSNMHWLHMSFISSMGTFLIFFSLWFAEWFRGIESHLGRYEWDRRLTVLTVLTIATILASQAFLAIGQRLMVVSTTALLRTLQLPMSMCFAAALAHQVPTRGYSSGAALVVASCFLQVALDRHQGRTKEAFESRRIPT